MIDPKPFPVLMAEDNPDDIVATQRAWRVNKIVNELRVVRDGEECLDYLYQRGRYADPASAPRPGLLLLDLNMPKLGGLEVLRTVKADPAIRHLPIVVLTTSKSEEDRIESYDLNANAYIMKPVAFDRLADAIRRIQRFWEIVELPDLTNGYR